jgi:hypothetical protein
LGDCFCVWGKKCTKSKSVFEEEINAHKAISAYSQKSD